MFRSKFSEDIFNHKYRHDGAETWDALASTLVTDVCSEVLMKDEVQQLYEYIRDMKFIPGGRYLYYAGRPNKFFNNCYLLRAEADTREDWADLSWKSESCLMTGGEIGIDYSIYRLAGTPIQRTGGKASGPIPKMNMINIENGEKFDLINLNPPSEASKIGIRPEHLSLANSGSHKLKGTVRHIENLGEHLLCYVNLEMNSEITAKLDVNSDIRVNEIINLNWHQDHQHFFDSMGFSIN